MSAADEAYKAAVAEIERVREAGGEGGILDLSVDKFRALRQVPPEVADLPKVVWVYLDRTQITDAGLAALQRMAGLQGLSLNQTQITDAGLAALQGMAGLGSLSLDQTEITDAGLVELQGMAGLKWLSLNQTQITDAGLAALQGIPNLHWLFLAQTQITSLAALAGVARLEALDISGTKAQDLRPICELPLNGVANFGLRYADTPAVTLDPKLAELVGIDADKASTKETLAYLKNLPKYPAPLPWLQQDNLKPQEMPALAPQARQEPPLTRGQVAVKTSAAQIKYVLARPVFSQITAKEIADQIRAGLRDVRRESNALPDLLMTMEALADALDGIGKARIGPKEKNRVDDLKLHIGQLEAQVAKLSQELAQAEQARETAEALAQTYSAKGAYKAALIPKLAEQTALTAGFTVRVGIVGGAIYFLGATNPLVVGLLGVLAALKS